MRILFLTPRLPYPPNRGDRLRVFHFLKRLSREHQLTLASFIAQREEREHVAALEAYCQEVHTALLSPRQSVVQVARSAWRPDPLQVLYYRSTAMQRLVQTLLASTRYDAAYIHLFRMAPYLAASEGLYRIVDLTDLISEELIRSLPYRSPAGRLLYRMESRRIQRFERHVARSYEETWLISQADRQALAQACPDANIQVVGNGVDLDTFFPLGQEAEPHLLLFTGHMGVFHNVDAAVYLTQEILPRVQRRVPACRLAIVGAEPDGRVQALSANPTVTVTGFVPDLNAYLNRATVVVAPLRFAAGVQNKALEALAAGRPLVTTSVVNRGLGAEEGRDLIVADEVDGMAREIISLLQDPAKQRRIASAGLQFVRRHHSWEQVAQRMRAVEAMLYRDKPQDKTAQSWLSS